MLIILYIYILVHSSLADYSRLMLRDCSKDLEEILRCRYCYKYSIQKNSKFWFCKPCKPPHELVYAKQDDFPYWPAKVNLLSNCHRNTELKVYK